MSSSVGTSSPGSSYDEIVACADRYRDALLAADLPTRLGASEDVLRARLALAECLMDAGWMPTARNLAAIHQDEELLLQSNGALDPSEGWYESPVERRGHLTWSRPSAG
ncbi:MAG: hypothetical protein QOE05_730 [Actinomycetota bacterium]|jgi:hypothetical protein|nr:hypothetical protein [Actinomycetota bacterium]